jgi:hypothetical protein
MSFVFRKFKIPEYFIFMKLSYLTIILPRNAPSFLVFPLTRHIKAKNYQAKRHQEKNSFISSDLFIKQYFILLSFCLEK